MDETISQASPEPIVREDHKRALYIAVVALYPILFSAILALLVYHFGGFKDDASVGRITEFASIDYPDKKGIGSANPFPASGSIFKIPDNKLVYLVERKEGLYWPKKRLGGDTGNWEWNVYATESKGYKFHIVLLAVDAAGANEMDEWTALTQKTRKYPGMKSVSGSEELATLRIVRD